MSRVRRADRDEVIYHLRRARQRRLLSRDEYADRVASAQQAEDLPALTGLLADLQPAPTPRAPGTTIFRPPPTAPAAGPAELDRLERRSRQLRSGRNRFAQLVSIAIGLAAVVGVFAGLTFGINLVSTRQQQWLWLPLVLALGGLGAWGALQLTMKLSATLLRRREREASRLARQAFVMRTSMASRPRDEFVADNPDGVGPATPRDSHTADEPSP